jgi:hypothetical protein
MSMSVPPGWGPDELASDTPVAEKIADTIAFLKSLPHTRWVLTAIIPDGDTKTVTFSQGQEVAAQKWLSKWDGFRNLYFSLAEPFIDHVSKLKKEHIDRVWCLHCDIDRRSNETREECKKRAFGALAKYQWRPSFTIDSGNGVQAIWIIEPIDPPPTDTIGQVVYSGQRLAVLEHIEGRNRGLALALGGDLSAVNADRIFRLPGTTNLPNKTKRAKGWDACPTRLIESTGCTYKLEEFEYASPQGGSAKAKVDALPVSNRIKDVIRTGDASAYNNDRSRSVFAVIIAMLTNGCDDATILGVLLDPRLGISAHILDQPKPQAYAERQIAHALEHVARQNNQQSQQAPPPQPQQPTPQPQQQQTTRGRFTPIFINDLVLDDEPSYLIDGLLPCGPAFGVVFGPPGSLKTFLLMDALLHLPQGKPYCGRPVLQKAVVYVTSEAVVGVKRRLIAMRRHHGIEGQQVPFGLVTVMPNLGTGVDDRNELIAAIEAAVTPFNMDVGAIAIDTDMSVFVENCEFVARYFKCLVPGIHHSPRSDDTRGSGSNSIDGASAFMWGVKRQEKELKAVASVARMKDGKDDDVTWAFDVVPAEIGQYPNGAPITSCHVEVRPFDVTKDAAARPARPAEKGKKQPPRYAVAIEDAVVDALLSSGVLEHIHGKSSNPKVQVVKAEFVEAEFNLRYAALTPDKNVSADAKRKAFERAAEHLPVKIHSGSWHNQDWFWKT